MANQFLNATEYANVMLLLLKNKLVMGKLVSGRFENKVTDENGLKVHVKRPPQFIAKSGATLAEQSIVTGSTSIEVSQYKNVHVAVTDLEQVQSYNALMKNAVANAAASTLAHDVDLYLHGQLANFPAHVGTPAESVKNPQQFNKVHTRLMEQSVQGDELRAVCSFEDGENIRGHLIGTNISGVNRKALERARIPVLSEVDLYATQHIRTIAAGTRAINGEALVDGAGQNVNYATVKDLDASDLLLKSFGNAKTAKAGDIFTIAGVYAVNNRSGQTLPYLRQFVVMEDAVSTAGGAVTLKIFPHIIVADTGASQAIKDTNTAFATVSAAPADGAAIVFYTAASAVTPIRAAFQKQAIELVSARLVTPMSDTSSFVTDPETGISIRYWRGSDIATGKHIHRWDMIYGAKNVDPRLGVRFSGAAL
jgi:hypothetical protein